MTKVLWHNMREEPVIYINGQPYVVRDLKNPLANLEYTGIDPATVENMEVRLKVRRASSWHGAVAGSWFEFAPLVVCRRTSCLRHRGCRT